MFLYYCFIFIFAFVFCFRLLIGSFFPADQWRRRPPLECHLLHHQANHSIHRARSGIGWVCYWSISVCWMVTNPPLKRGKVGCHFLTREKQKWLLINIIIYRANVLSWFNAMPRMRSTSLHRHAVGAAVPTFAAPTSAAAAKLQKRTLDQYYLSAYVLSLINCAWVCVMVHHIHIHIHQRNIHVLIACNTHDNLHSQHRNLPTQNNICQHRTTRRRNPPTFISNYIAYSIWTWFRLLGVLYIRASVFSTSLYSRSYMQPVSAVWHFDETRLWPLRHVPGRATRCLLSTYTQSKGSGARISPDAWDLHALYWPAKCGARASVWLDRLRGVLRACEIAPFHSTSPANACFDQVVANKQMSFSQNKEIKTWNIFLLRNESLWNFFQVQTIF